MTTTIIITIISTFVFLILLIIALRPTYMEYIPEYVLFIDSSGDDVVTHIVMKSMTNPTQVKEYREASWKVIGYD